MWYYYKSQNAFGQDLIDGEEVTHTYTDEEHDALYDTDLFHYVGVADGDELPSQIRYDDEKCIEICRKKREEVCFPIINRGEPWYSRLTAEQKAELDEWYQNWLDVTDTLVIPDKPEWLT